MDPLHFALAALAWLAGAALFVPLAYSVALFVYGRSVPSPDPPRASGAPTVTAVVASLAPSRALDATLRRLAAVDYPALDVAVALGGPAQVAQPEGRPVTVLHSPGWGKARALNYALKEARSRYVLVLDEDSLVDPDCIDRLIPLAEEPGTWAVVGVPYASNADAGPLQRTLALEAEAWGAAARAKDRLGLFIPATGFFSLMSVEALRGGGEVWDEGALAEDADLSLRQRARGLRTRLAAARVGIEAPGSVGALARQRLRWYRGMLDASWKNRRAVAGLPPKDALDVSLTLLSPLSPAAFVLSLLFVPAWPLILGPVLAATVVMYMLSAWAASSKLRRGRLGVVLFSPLYAVLQGGVALAALASFLLRVRVGWERTPKAGDYPQEPNRPGGR